MPRMRPIDVAIASFGLTTFPVPLAPDPPLAQPETTAKPSRAPNELRASRERVRIAMRDVMREGSVTEGATRVDPTAEPRAG